MPVDRETRIQIRMRADRLQDLFARTAGKTVTDCATLMIDMRMLGHQVANDVHLLLAAMDREGGSDG